MSENRKALLAPLLWVICVHTSTTLYLHTQIHIPHIHMHTTGTHMPCAALMRVHTRRCVPQASTHHGPTRCYPLISASLLMFLDAIPGQIFKILAQKGQPPQTATQEEVGAFPLEFPCPEWLSHFLFTKGRYCMPSRRCS